ncbi:putative protein N(5)-glutamine methyltransferase [Jatrophihabitans sp. DSM 45814]
MSTVESSWTYPKIVARLRGAGCVFAEDEARLLLSGSGTSDELMTMVERRAAGVPLEHVLGWAEFYGRRVLIDAGVFVPRRRTEFLVTQSIEALTPMPRRRTVVDLCCGSGAIGASIFAALSDVELHATDIDATAVRCARRNVALANGQVYEGDLYDPLPIRLKGRVDLVVANVPYVPTSSIPTMPPEARDYETQVALDGGPDGLDVLRLVIARAPQWLAPGASVMVETSEGQAAAALATISRQGLAARVTTSDELNATVVIGTKPANW